MLTPQVVDQSFCSGGQTECLQIGPLIRGRVLVFVRKMTVHRHVFLPRKDDLPLVEEWLAAADRHHAVGPDFPAVPVETRNAAGGVEETRVATISDRRRCGCCR